MSSARRTDLTFRMDRTGNMVLGKRGEYVCNIVKMLFAMVPGTDEYEPDKGLDITGKQYKQYTENTRDTEYENQIVKQFTTYTDLIPINVVAMYMTERIYVYMSIKFEGEIYEIDLTSSKDSLSTVLRTK